MNVDPDQPQQLYARFPRRLKAAVLDTEVLAAMMLAGLELAALTEPRFERAHWVLIALFARIERRAAQVELFDQFSMELLFHRDTSGNRVQLGRSPQGSLR